MGILSGAKDLQHTNPNIILTIVMPIDTIFDETPPAFKTALNFVNYY
jgi:hypothetical protein